MAHYGKVVLTPDELILRFETGGGQLYHYKGQRRCFASTMRVGRFRFGHQHNSLLHHDDLYDRTSERLSIKTCRETEGRLVVRARALPIVEPTMAMLNDFLTAIDAHTLTYDQVGDQVRHWMFMIEVWCRTREASEAFLYQSHAALPGALKRFAPQFYRESVNVFAQ